MRVRRPARDDEYVARLPAQHSIPYPCLTLALDPADALDVIGARFGEAGVEKLDDLDVEAVQPDHRLGAVIAVVVPGPGWGDHEIARLHRRALAIDGGIGAASLDDEAQRRLR